MDTTNVDWGKFWFSIADTIRPAVQLALIAFMGYAVSRLNELKKQTDANSAKLDAASQERESVKKKVEETHAETISAVQGGAANQLAQTIIAAEESHNAERQPINRG